MDKFLEWSGAITGAFGTYIIALDLDYKLFAFVAFFAANLFISAFAYSKGHKGLLTQQCLFVPGSIIGMINYY